MNRRFEPAGRLRGSITPPADKSISHRAALFGAMSDEPVTIHNYLDAEDTQSTLGALRAIGAGVDESAPGETVVRGVGLHAALETTTGHVDVGNSGTLLRLLPGWLAGQPGQIWTLDGDESIRRRPIDRIAAPLRMMGCNVEARDERFTPMTVHGAELSGIHYTLPVATAQVKSCVLIAGMLASGQTSVTEPAQSRDHTERMLRRARVPFERDGLTVRVSEVDELELDEITVPADPSSAAFHAAAAAIVGGSHVVLRDVGLNWTRTAFFRILVRMGAVVVGDLEEEPETTPDIEPYGDLDIRQAPLEGTTIAPEEVPLAIDELPLVALLGCFAEGETVVTGAEELRVKETDRLTGVVDGLRGLGADIEALADGFVVRGGGTLRGGTIDALGDHRMAMLGAVAGLGSEEGVEVVGMEAAAVSYPRFEADLGALLR
ncbi:MAG: 3-phosphoshikimate 1-carboxyvinyltransferase [Thermoleophilaceae bacterium]|nr:3-phosphoshikimate 1-carboxyvinyltransferase [Thermoleophilaceae bacterium]